MQQLLLISTTPCRMCHFSLNFCLQQECLSVLRALIKPRSSIALVRVQRSSSRYYHISNSAANQPDPGLSRPKQQLHQKSSIGRLRSLWQCKRKQPVANLLQPLFGSESLKLGCSSSQVATSRQINQPPALSMAYREFSSLCTTQISQHLLHTPRNPPHSGTRAMIWRPT